MPKQTIVYLSDDDARVLELCEVCGLIPNRSKWLRSLLNEFAVENKVRIAMKQRIKELKEELAAMEALELELDSVDVDRDIIWAKLVKQFCARGNGTTTRRADLDWLSTRKRELKATRPDKTTAEVLLELYGIRDGMKMEGYRV